MWFSYIALFLVFSPPLWLIVHSSCFCIDIGEHVCVTENTYITFWPHKRRYICDSSYNSNKNSPYFYRLLQLNTAVSWLYTIWNVRYFCSSQLRRFLNFVLIYRIIISIYEDKMFVLTKIVVWHFFKSLAHDTSIILLFY